MEEFMNIALKKGFKTGVSLGAAFWLLETAVLLSDSFRILGFPGRLLFNLVLYALAGGILSAAMTGLHLLTASRANRGETGTAGDAAGLAARTTAFAFLTAFNAVLLTGNLGSLGGSFRGLVPLYACLYFCAAWVVSGFSTEISRPRIGGRLLGSVGAALLVPAVYLSASVPGRLVSPEMFMAVSVAVFAIFSLLYSLTPRAWLSRNLVRVLLTVALLFVIFRWVGAPLRSFGLGRTATDEAGATTGETSTARHGTGETRLKYNFVLLVIDTLRADSVPPHASLPAMERLAARSLVFKNARALSPWTAPSMAALFASVYPAPLSMTQSGIDPELFRTLYLAGKWKETWFRSMTPRNALTRPETSISAALSAAGYRTAAFVNNPLLTASSGFGAGFDLYRLPLELDRGDPATLFSKTLAGKTGFHEASGTGTPANDQLKRDGKLVLEALDWIEAEPGAPFFAWLHLMAPHMPYTPAEPPASAPDYEGLVLDAFTNETLEMCRAGRFSPDRNERGRIEALYRREVAETDSVVGIFLDGLKDLGVLDQTLIVLTSDHGEEFWEHGGIEHGHSMFDELLRVPLYLHCPWRAAPGESDTPVFLTDVYPTVLDLLIPGREGDTAWNGSAGRSLFRESGRDSTVFFAGTLYGPQLTAAIEGNRKMVHDPSDSSFVMYDLVSDPLEKIPAPVPRDYPLAMKLLVWEKAAAAENTATETAVDESMVESLKSLGYLN